MSSTNTDSDRTTAPTGLGEVARSYGLIDSTRALSISAAWLRANVDLLRNDLCDFHGRTRMNDLDQRAYDKATRNDVPALLEELATRRGMGWADIAAAAEKSVSAVRKWRNGGAATSESRQQLARVAALLDFLEDSGVADPAQWMEMSLPLPDGYHIRPLDLFEEGKIEAMLELVDPVQSTEQILDEALPNWRERRSEFEVFTSSDGQRSLRRRGDDDA